MKMPVHIFMSLCNILAGQFKKESEEQQREQESATMNLPNISSLTDFSNIQFPNFNVPSI